MWTPNFLQFLRKRLQGNKKTTANKILQYLCSLTQTI